MTKRLIAHKIWHSNCQICRKLLTNHGSGRAKTICSTACKNKIRKQRYKPILRKPRLHLNPYEAHELINDIKIKLGACTLHKFYFKTDLICTRDYLRAFCFDHIDRAKKHKSISAMIGCSSKQQLLDEVDKCVLVCANCHQIKTYEDNDYVQIVKVLKQQMQTVYDQLTLFDN